jgi:uncharacterized protein
MADENELTYWQQLLNRKVSRRTALRGAVLAGAAATLPLYLRCSPAPAETSGRRPSGSAAPFSPIFPSSEDRLILPPGFRYDVVAAWQDDIGAGQFGFNADYTAFFPIDLFDHSLDLSGAHRSWASRAASSTEGILAVNHEYPNARFVSRYSGSGPKSAEQQRLEQQSLGMSFVRVSRDRNGRWQRSAERNLNRRIDALTPMRMTGPAALLDGGPVAIGTMANCSGGVTPWGTVLTCEENFDDYPRSAPRHHGWDPATYGKRHYGWVVEVDPFDPRSTPRKQTAMGRFHHENVAIRIGSDGTVAAYSGDDKAGSCIYKFIADRKITDTSDRSGNSSILESGSLYAADFENGRWLLLDYERQPALHDARRRLISPRFNSQAEVLAEAHDAAMVLGATPLDRPEDIEIHPIDGSVYVALTNNLRDGNYHGQIVRIEESGNDPASLTFDWSLFASGGADSGFSSPDNLTFDSAGNLWMCTDISTKRIGTGRYTFHGNNALFFFTTRGAEAGLAHQFASGPVESELTGPSWTPDESTLFLAVQHPGELSPSWERPTSRWPYGGEDIPRPAVVAITGFR